MASSGGLTSFSFNSNTLSVTAGGTGQLTLALDSADLSAEVGRTITFTSSYTPITTVSPGTATIEVATHSYSITVTGVSAGSAAITATCTDSQGVTWTSTATITVASATQVIVAEQSLQDIADAIRGKLGVNAAYKPADMASAIASISSGGGGDDNIITGFFTTGSTTETSRVITHNMGVLPRIFICVCAYADRMASTYNSSTPTPARFWLCNTNMATGGNSGWSTTHPTESGLWVSTHSQRWTYGAFGQPGTSGALDTGTSGMAYYFNMNTTTATVKSGGTSDGIGTNATFFWVAVKALE